MSRDRAHYEPVAWWFTRGRLGRDLRKEYELPTALPSKMLALIRELDGREGGQFIRGFQRADSGSTADFAISTQDLVLASERAIAELDAPAPPISGDRR
jgi:hypothetical protein